MNDAIAEEDKTTIEFKVLCHLLAKAYDVNLQCPAFGHQSVLHLACAREMLAITHLVR